MNLRISLTIVSLLLISCSKVPLVKSGKAARSNVEATVTSVNSGVVKSEKIAELAFGAVGRVRKLNVKLGDIVEKDFVIAEIENEDMLSALSTATRELDRQRALMSKGLSSQTLIDQAQSNLQLAQNAHEKTLIRAPFRGLIAELNLEVGQLSQITTELRQALVRLVDLEPRFIRAEIDEVDMPRVRAEQNARIKVLAVRKEPFNGVVRKIVPFVSSIREQDRTSEIELNIESDQLLPVGASADVEIVVERKESVLAVPLRSIFNSGGKKYVYKFENGKARKTEVELGISNFDVAEIKSGVQDGEIVLIPTDTVELEDGLKVQIE